MRIRRAYSPPHDTEPDPGRPPRVDRPDRADASAAAGLDGRLGPLLRDPRDQRGPGPERHPAAVDLRHLRLRPGRPADDDGSGGRPLRPPPAAPAGRGGLRCRLPAGRLRAHRRDADRRPRDPRHRRRHPDAVDDGAGPHDVHRPLPAGQGDRAVVRRDDGRDRARLGAERRPRRALLVGLGLPGQPAGDGPAAGPRPAAAPGVPQPLTGPLRPAERPAVDGGRAARGLRPEGTALRGLERPLRRLDHRRPAVRRAVRAPPAHGGVADDPAGALPRPRLHPGAGPQHPVRLRDDGLRLLHHPVPPVGPGQERTGGRAVEPAAVGAHRRRRAGRRPAGPAGGGARVRRDGRLRHGGRRLRAAGPVRHRLALAGAGRLRRPGRRHRRRDVPAHRSGAEFGPGGEGGLGLLAAGDRHRVRRRDGDGGPRLHRHRALPPRHAVGRARTGAGDPRRRAGRRRRTAGARGRRPGTGGARGVHRRDAGGLGRGGAAAPRRGGTGRAGPAAHPGATASGHGKRRTG